MFEQTVTAIFYFFKSLGLSGAFLSMALENLGVPLPTEIGYLIGQNLINIEKSSYLVVLLVLTLGHIAGSLISYKIGRLGDNFVSKRLRQNYRVIEISSKLKSWYKRYGNATVFLARFVGYVRPWSSFIAGFAGVAFLPFLFWTALGSLIFNIFALYFSQIFIFIWRRYTTYHFIFALLSLLLFFGLFIYEFVRQKVRTKNKKRTPRL